MKLSRYSASGTTHSSGTGARCVVTCVVTPSSKLDGSADRPTQRHSLLLGIGAGASFACASGTPQSAFAGLRMTTTAHTPTSSRYTSTPAAHPACCTARVNSGSISSGYASSPSRLPALLAAYRKYGSLADGCPVDANHRCNSGDVVDRTKNGTPTATARRATTPKMG